MELLIIVLGIAAAVALYFAAGIVVRFLWEWVVVIVALPVCLAVGLGLGWSGAVIGFIGFCGALAANNGWHSTGIYQAGAARIDKTFYFGDV